MAHAITVYRVFLATPSGLAPERSAFRTVLREYNDSDALEHSVMFHPVGWETVAPGIGRPQALINQDLRRCDYFVLALWDRWGSPPDAEGRHSSGCEEEYGVAMDCYRDPAYPMRQIAAFFKGVSPESLSAPSPQLQKVLSFKKSLEDGKELLFATFDDPGAFQQHLRSLLARWTREHCRNRSGRAARESRFAEFGPLAVPELPTSAYRGAPPSELVAEAERLANEGCPTDAEAMFAHVIFRSNDVDALTRYGRFLVRVGRLSLAQAIYEQILEVVGGDDRRKAEAYGELGLIHRTRGRLAQAIECQRRALEIDERSQRGDDMAVHYGNLGLIYRTVGDLALAEEMTQKALAIEEDAGRLEGMATQYGNLGILYQMRGDLDLAEQVQRKALTLEERLQRASGIASAYGNLGAIFVERGCADAAEPLLEQALQIDKRLGRLEGMANHYAQIGAVHRMSGQLDLAERALDRALEINEQLGRLKGQAENYGELALVSSARGDLEQAERLLRKALGIDERLGRLEGMARRYLLLGHLYRSRNELAPARALFEKAHDLFLQVGLAAKAREIAESV